jgi:parvulin-like peptidyl-prolyl isomerase
MTKFKIQNKSKIQNSNIKTKVLVFFICALTLFCHLCFDIFHLAFAQDKIVAIVNGDCITKKDLDDFTTFMRIQKEDISQPDLLEKLIEDRLILQEAKKSSIKVDENRIKARINEIRARYNSNTEFQDDLARQGMTQADLEQKIREQMLMYSIIEQRIRDKIVVSPPEVTAFYNGHKKEFTIGQQRELEVFALSNQEDAKSFSRDLENGQEIEGLLSKYSAIANKLSWTDEGQLNKEIEGEVIKLKIGAVSKPIKVEDKYYILRLQNMIPPRELTMPEAQDRIFPYLFEKKMEEKLSEWLDVLKKQSYVKIIQD